MPTLDDRDLDAIFNEDTCPYVCVFASRNGDAARVTKDFRKLIEAVSGEDPWEGQPDTAVMDTTADFVGADGVLVTIQRGEDSVLIRSNSQQYIQVLADILAQAFNSTVEEVYE